MRSGSARLAALESAAAGEELVLQPGVALHQCRRVVRLDRRHRLGGLAQLAGDDVESAGGQDPVPGQLLRVSRGGVLREVADRAVAGQRPLGGLRLAGEDPRHRRLAGTVAADQPDAVTGADAELRVGDQDPGADAHREARDADHVLPILRELADRQRCRGKGGRRRPGGCSPSRC